MLYRVEVSYEHGDSIDEMSCHGSRNTSVEWIPKSGAEDSEQAMMVPAQGKLLRKS